eukprot:TRINITY_DN1926_c0_g1_i1.p2 TRINITY_DN1926_c0_g1~~TRINITY_DN1926_c0_g1_i1.p2  ORF type:complete len:114 (-),score=20.31 TRINITY_DN1926_c0_g1_i1:57-398(-)
MTMRNFGTLPYMAPEIFDRKRPKYTESYDVYSYGIVLWELFSASLKPYPDSIPTHALPGLVMQGKRPEMPLHINEQIAKLMRACWHRDPTARPSFQQVLGVLVQVQRAAGVLL